MERVVNTDDPKWVPITWVRIPSGILAYMDAALQRMTLRVKQLEEENKILREQTRWSLAGGLPMTEGTMSSQTINEKYKAPKKRKTK